MLEIRANLEGGSLLWVLAVLGAGVGGGGTFGNLCILQGSASEEPKKVRLAGFLLTSGLGCQQISEWTESAFFWCVLFIIIIFNLFIFVLAVLLCRSYSSLRCTGFSLWWLLLLRSTGSRHVGSQELWHTGSVVVARGL